MLKRLIYISQFVIFSFWANAQSIPNSSMQTIEGDNIQLSMYQGKKLLVIVLPVSHSIDDSLMLLNIESAFSQYKDSIAFIGVPSYEDGYADSTNTDIENWYKNILHLSFTITSGMYTHNSSGGQQSSLFQWLTNETLNGHFGTDTNTYGQKFLINQDGELKGVFDPTTPLYDSLMNLMVEM